MALNGEGGQAYTMLKCMQVTGRHDLLHMKYRVPEMRGACREMRREGPAKPLDV